MSSIYTDSGGVGGDVALKSENQRRNKRNLPISIIASAKNYEPWIPERLRNHT